MGERNPDWEELQAALDDELVRAVAAAFALVATADRDLAESEIERFLQVVREDPALAPAMNFGLENAFRALAQGVLDDPEQGWFVCLAVLRKCRRHDLIVRVAQIAIVADGQLKEQEEAALARIEATLNVD